MNKTILFFFVAIISFHFGCNSEKEPSIADKPNVILFLIDDYGYGDISYEGNTQIMTPNIDRIATEGAHFTRFYQSSGACAPTRASLLTGRYYLETGVWGVHFGRDFIRRDETTIADLLKQEGYTTGAFGKWHSGKTWRYFSWNRGFDVGVHPVLYRYWDSRVIFNNKLVNADGPITDVVGDQVVKFISDNKEKPFFAYVPFQSIHEPFNCPADVFQKYKAQGYSNHVARMYGMIEVLDNNIGKILNSVDDLGLADNTVVMFLVDDGPSPGVDLSYSNRRMIPEERAERERGWSRKLRGGKASIYEGGSVSPFYIKWKDKITSGTEFSHLSGVIDLLPTIIDICGVDLPADNLPIAGRSLWPAIRGEATPEFEERKYYDNTNFYRIPRWTIDMEYPEMREISVVHKNYKLVRTNRKLYGEDKINFELFDLAEDPAEEKNIFEDHPEISLDLKQSAERWYDAIVKGGRAFPQAVYEVGNWAERGTPINLDAVKEVKGSVGKSAESEFRFDGWTSRGAGMVFEIDVIESGEYAVELFYSCAEDALGAEFKVYTEHDQALVKINDTKSAISKPLNLPAGIQQLTIELMETLPGKSAVDVMSMLIIHRIPGPNDNDVLQGRGFNLIVDGVGRGTFYVGNDVADFMRNGGRQDDAKYLDPGTEISIVPFAENMDQVAQIEVFFDFKSVEIRDKAPFDIVTQLPPSGKYTLNVEFTSRAGVKNAARSVIVIN